MNDDRITDVAAQPDGDHVTTNEVRANLEESLTTYGELWDMLADGDRDRDFAAQLDEYQASMAFVAIYERLAARLDAQWSLIHFLLDDREIYDARLADMTDRCARYDNVLAALEDRLNHQQRCNDTDGAA